MKTEPISKHTAPPKKAKKAFFGAKKKMDVKLNKVAKKAITPITPKVKPKKEKTETKKNAIHSLQKPAKEIKKTSKKYQKHKKTENVLEEAQNAAILPSAKANRSVANKSQVETMSSQTTEKKGFNKDKFKDTLQIEINKTVNSKKDAKKIKDNGVDDKVTDNISDTVAEEKNTAAADGKIEKSTVIPPELPVAPIEETTSKEPIGLEKIKPESKTVTSQKADLAPVKKPAEETDLTKETKVLDDDYKQNNLSQEKLQNSNEPQFIAADNQKQTSQEKAKEITEQTRANESKTISNTRNANSKAINNGYNTMLEKKSTNNSGIFDKQKEKRDEEFKIRSDVSKESDAIFTRTNNLVISIFNAIDFYVNTIFGLRINIYLDKFSRRVAQLLDDNTGFFNNVGAFVTGDELLSEAKIFDIAKEEFLDDMKTPINDLVDFVDKGLTNAEIAIKNGEEENEKFWSKQSADTLRIAGDIREGSNSKFEDLEKSVASKEEAIIDTVTEKFSAALDELDARFEKAKIENMSWLDRAIAAVKSVINTIIDLKNAIQNIAKKAAAYAERIIDDPITFFGNLADGVGQGFTNFKNNIDKHLIKGVLQWLTGSMEGSEIILPKELNFEGITSLVMQILGISIKKIKGLVIDIIGKERFEFIEKGVDVAITAGNNILNIFKILNEKGLEGLWEFIKEEFHDLKEMLIENVKTFVIETITQKAVEYLLSLLIPGAGFIRAAQLLIKFVITLFQKASQILKIIEGIIDTFGDILNRNLSGAAAKVENVFSNFLSLAISFLAAVLGLNGIVGKVQKFIQKTIRPKIDKVLNSIAKKIKEIVVKIGLTKLIDKSMKAVDKGKAWVEEKKKKAIEKGKAGLGKIAEWLGIKKAYKSKDGNKHTLSFEEVNKKPVMMRASVKSTFDAYISNIKSKVAEYNTKNPTSTVDFAAIENQYKLIKVQMGKYDEFKKNDVSGNMNKLADLLSQLPDDLADANVFFPNHKIVAKSTTETVFSGSSKSTDGDNINVENLSIKLGALKGSPGKHTSKLFSHIHGKVSNKGQLIRGHLLNHYLGGSGDIAENIMPIAKKTNDDMERSSDNVVKERLAKEKLMSGNVFDYTVKVKYKKSSLLDADVPGNITMSFNEKIFDSSKPKNKANMEDGANWKKSKNGLPSRDLDAKTELENLL